MTQVIYEFEMPDGSVLEIEGEEGKQAEATAKARQYINAQQPTLTELGKDVARSVHDAIVNHLTDNRIGDMDKLHKIKMQLLNTVSNIK